MRRQHRVCPAPGGARGEGTSTATAPAQLGYTDVVTAQASALSARRAFVQMALDRQVTAITLIQALGGGWDVAAPVQTRSSVRDDNPADRAPGPGGKRGTP